MTSTARNRLLERFPRERTWLLPTLEAVQERERWLSPDALAAVADHLRVPRSEVYGVATHYPELRLVKPGRRVVRVCIGVSCRIQGSLATLAHLERQLGVSAEGTTPDGELSLERMDCGFNCSMAPLVEIDGRHLGRALPAEVDQVLAALLPPEPDHGVEEEEEEEHKESASFILFPTPTPSPIPPARRPNGGGATRWLAAIERAARSMAPPPALRLAVELGSCSLSVGAAATLAALAEGAERRGLDARVGATGCSGLCWAAPVLRLTAPDGATVLVPRVTAPRVPSLLGEVAGWAAMPDDVAGFFAGQQRVLSERVGVIDPRDIADAIRRGSYAMLARVLAEDRPDAVIETVKAARLQGRGGAYFQTAVKWEGARRAAGQPKYLVVNAEEGEPGIFKDRHLMEGDPHRLLEGALIAAYAAGASVVYFYVHGEAHLSARRLARAVEDARHWGLISRHVLGSAFSVNVEVRRGAGGFVLGEETALMESIEGRRAMPRAKPPFPVDSGLWGRPTVINNVETLFAIPLILERGPDWWRSLGAGHGTKCFGLSGHVRRPGLAEVELGVSLRTLLERIGGGTPDGRELQAVLVGGPSGILVHPRQLDEPMVPGGAVNPGTGGVVALGAGVSVRDVVRTLLDFNTRESCGKCTPCREGTARLRDMLDAPGPAAAGAVPELAEVVRLTSLCGLGQAAPLSILAALREFPEALGHLAEPVRS